MARIFAIAAAAVVILFIGWQLFLTKGQVTGDPADKFAQCRTAKVAGGAAKIGGSFTLVDETGKTVTDKDVIDQPSLVYFGYTFCPDVCPLDNARNAEAVAILEEQGKIVKPVFISIDPKRDTPEVLADFTDNLHERMIGLTGSPEQVKAASKAYRTFYQKQEPEAGSEDLYLMDHSTFTYLVTPEDGFLEFFKRGETPEQMAEKLSCFLDAM